jgi:hypothetical protein
LRRPWLPAVACAIACAAAVAASGCGGTASGEGHLTSLSTTSAASAPSHQGKSRSDKNRGSVRSSGNSRATRVAAAAATADRSEFVRRADVICRRTHAQIGAVGRRLVALVERVRHKSVGIREYYRRSADLTHASARIALRSVTRLRSLPRPARDRRLAAYLASSANQAHLLEDQAGALRSGAVRRVAAINRQLAQAASRSHAIVRGYGFKSCAGGAG